MELVIALPCIAVLAKGCQMTAGIFGCHGRPGTMCRSRHPAGSVEEELVRIAFLLLGILAGHTKQECRGVITITWLKADHIPTQELGVRVSGAIIWIPNTLIRCLAAQCVWVNSEQLASSPSFAVAWGKFWFLSYSFLTGKKRGSWGGERIKTRYLARLLQDSKLKYIISVL